jgi:hypothetical protein
MTQEAKWTKVNNELDLRPRTMDGVVYIEWSTPWSPATTNRTKAAWNRFSAKQCDGKDAVGKYYRNRTHAMSVIRDFKKKVKA